MIGNVPSLAPVGIPKGVDPRTWRQAIEKKLNDLLDQSLALITALDMMEVEPDSEDNGDAEEWLGWNDRGQCGVNTDRELDEADDELTLGAPEVCFFGGNYSHNQRTVSPSLEPRTSQVGWSAGANYVGADECEVTCEDEGAQCDDEGVTEAL